MLRMVKVGGGGGGSANPGDDVVRALRTGFLGLRGGLGGLGGCLVLGQEFSQSDAILGVLGLSELAGHEWGSFPYPLIIISTEAL